MSSTVLLMLAKLRAGQALAGDAWERHTGLLAKVPSVRCAVTNIVRSSDVPMPIPRGPWVLDVITQLALASDAQPEVAMDSPAFQLAIGAARALLADCLVLVTQRVDVLGCSDLPPGTLKRMSLLQRDPSSSTPEFQRWWKTVHGPRVAQLGTLLSSAQYHVQSARAVISSGDACWQQVPDGVTELRLPNEEVMLDTFRPQGNPITWHAASRIHRISPFVVEEYRLS